MQGVIDILVDNRHNKYNLNSYGKEVVSFGRSSECDIQIPKNYISRVHGCFYLENGEWFIKDMNSTNGIYFNSNKIDALRLALGPIRISKNMNSEDYITITMDGVNAAPQFGGQPNMMQNQYGGQPNMMQNQYGGQPNMMQNQYAAQPNMMPNQFGQPMKRSGASSRAIDVGWGLKIAMICLAVAMVVACFIPYCSFSVGGSLGSWGKYLDDALGSESVSIFTDSYVVMGFIIVTNSILLLVFALLSHIYGLDIANLIISFFNPIWSILALIAMKSDTFGMLKASIGFYILLASSIGATIVAIMIFVKAKGQKKSSTIYGM